MTIIPQRRSQYYILILGGVLLTLAQAFSLFLPIRLRHVRNVRPAGSNQRSLSRRPFSPAPPPDNKPDNDLLTPEEDYRMKLRELDVAMAAAEDARQKLLSKSTKPTNDPLPLLSGATLSRTDAGTLILDLPAPGLDTGSIFAGAFSLAWFSVVLPATLAGAGLFMLPFWAAGGLVAKNAVVDPFVGSRLELGQYAWSLTSRYAGRTLKRQEGATEQLRGARVELPVIVNGRPMFELKLYGDKKATVIASGFSEEELEYLAREINEHLRTVKDMPDDSLITR